MPDEMSDTPEDNGHGEHTGRVLAAAKEAVHSELGVVKKIQFWITLGLTIAGLGFGAALFLNRYAAAADVEKLADKADDINKQLSSHIAVEASRMGAIEAQAKNVEEDYHWTRDQLTRVADRVGAARVPVPEHAIIKPAPPERTHP
jgi:hypothetical protein